MTVVEVRSCHRHSSCEDSTTLSWRPKVWMYGATCCSMVMMVMAIQNTLPWRERRITPWWNKKTCLAVFCKSFFNSMILPDWKHRPLYDRMELRLGIIHRTSSASTSTSTNINIWIRLRLRPHDTARQSMNGRLRAWCIQKSNARSRHDAALDPSAVSYYSSC